jgi:hypothetical protein
MAKLIYSAITSLDGYVADEDGSFDWVEPDEEVHTFINDLERPVGTYLYGRRMCEVMVAPSPWSTSRPSSGTSRRYGRRLTRSVLQDAGDGNQCQDAARARFRP